MKQHLAKSLLMAGAMVASCPLFAQQAQPIQPTQPMQSIQPMPAGQPSQAMPMAAPSAQDTMPAARDPYAQGATQPMQPAMDPSGASLAPDALGTHLGQRNRTLDGG